MDDYGNSLQQLQRSLESSCKSFLSLKSGRENLNRLSMTTLVECLVSHLYKSEYHHIEGGKHCVEEKIVKVPKAKLTEKVDDKRNNHIENKDKETRSGQKPPVGSPLKILGSFVENEDKKYQNLNPFTESHKPETKIQNSFGKSTMRRDVIEVEDDRNIDNTVIETMRSKK